MAIGDAWKQQPTMRLGQFISNVIHSMYASNNCGYTASQRTITGLAFIEDGDLAHNLLLWAATRQTVKTEPTGMNREEVGTE